MSVNIAKAMMQMYGLGSVPTPITQSQPTIASPVLGNVEDAFEDLPVVDTTADIAGVNKVK
jgi:hypothetical protein